MSVKWWFLGKIVVLGQSTLVLNGGFTHNNHFTVIVISKMPSCFDGQRLAIKAMCIWCRKWAFLY